MKAYWGSGGIAPCFLDLGGECLVSRPGHFTPRERAPGTHWIGDWLGRRAGLDAVMKIKIPSFCKGLEPPIIQPVTERYTAELTRLRLCNFVINLIVKYTR
jgi:hypothetical protein